jgi:hypothetical protein
VRKTAFFFYGTLMDRDMLSAVLERRVWPRSLVPAVLRGHRRKGVRGANYPVVLRQRRASVDGVIFDGVGTVEPARVSTYEGDRYELVQALAELPRRRCVRVFIFAPRLGAYVVSNRRWTFAGWRLRHKRSAMIAVAGGRGPGMRR